MRFLQLWVLWALPLMLVPLIIHLLNRMRYKSMDWAAIMFLLKANRSSTRLQRWRHLLILLLRMLLVGGVVMALARPLASGWMGWALSGPPDTIVLLLDRSASMERLDPATRQTRRARAMALLAAAAEPMAQTSRIVLIDSASLRPQALSSPAILADLADAAPTETAADLPAMLQAAADYIVANQAGVTEIWIASDLQRSNWDPDGRAWPGISARLAAMPQSVRVRLLALGGPAEDNLSVRVLETTRARRGGASELTAAFEISRASVDPLDVPVAICVDGDRRQAQYRLQGQTFAVHERIALGDKKTAGWGWIELPSDSCPTDNRAYFVYGEDRTLTAVVAGATDAVSRTLALAAAPSPETQNHAARVVGAEDPGRMNLAEAALLVWQLPFPDEREQGALKAFLESGGVMLCLPPPEPSGALLGRWRWGDAEEAAGGTAFAVARWEERSGPLVRSASGEALPLSELVVKRRRPIVGDVQALAEMADGRALLSQARVGEGRVLFCSTLPEESWSSLADGFVLVPMMQRLLQDGGRRLQSVESADCGAWRPADGADAPGSVEGEKDYRTQAGVYHYRDHLVALNRPEREDIPAEVDGADVKALFGEVPFSLLQSGAGRDDRLQSEIWRLFLCCVLVFMVSEGFLILPAGPRKAPPQAAGKGKR